MLDTAEKVYQQSENFEAFADTLTKAVPARQNRIVLNVNERYLYPKKAK
jgi:hypothetical protein